jgi:hypothetical protein
MEHRYVCTSCGLKWFDPHPERGRPEPVACEACGGPLRPLAQEPGAPGFAPDGPRTDAGDDGV